MTDSLARALRAEGRSENTVYSYTLSVRLLRDFLAERDRPLTVDVDRGDLRDFLALQAKPRTITDSEGRKHKSGSPATAMVRYKSLRAFFKHCVLEEELDANPMDNMRPPKVEAEPVPIVSDDVLGKLLAARSGKTLEDRRDTAMLRVFLDTGARLSEVTGLRLSDVDLNAQTLRVLGKGARIRHVSYGVKTASALDRYRRLLEREYPERVADPDGRLWIGRQGAMSTSGVTDVLHRMCADAGVPRLHWHQLRHTFAHRWLASGGGEGDLMTLAGWQSRAMLDRYGKSAQVARAQDAARRLSLGDRV